MEIKLPSDVFYILQRLNVCGYQAYVVGGCVRDSIMGLTPHDWDICTSALPEQIAEVFRFHKIIPTGLKHGTVTVVVNDNQYEITTYRIDGEYKDHRRPSSVSFTNNLKKDLARRDFTINAMAYHPTIGLVDEFGGMRDIGDGIICCVGNPDDRFQEDALRILRAIRFSITFGYAIELCTSESMRRNYDLLKSISKERICQEMTKALEKGYDHELGLALSHVIPELTTERQIMVDRRLIGIANTTLQVRLAVLFDFDSQTDIQRILKSMKFDNRTVKNVCDIQMFVRLIRFTNEKRYPLKVIVKHLLNQNASIAREALECLRLYELSGCNDIPYGFSRRLQNEYIYCIHECYKISDLEIDGNDLLALGYSGMTIGLILDKLLEDVIWERVVNRRDKLMEYLGKLRNE